MSRTYRNHPVEQVCNCGVLRRECGHPFAYSYGRHLYKRDHINVVPSWFKTIRRRKNRAKINHYMVNGNYDNIPYFKKTDRWDWF